MKTITRKQHFCEVSFKDVLNALQVVQTNKEGKRLALIIGRMRLDGGERIINSILALAGPSGAVKTVLFSSFFLSTGQLNILSPFASYEFG